MLTTECTDWFVAGSLSFEMLKGLPAAVITLVIGTIAAYIAWQQWRVSQAKLNLDLFQRRLEIFELTWGALSRAHLHVRDPEKDLQFSNRRPEARFLFGVEVADYMSEIVKKQITLDMLLKISQRSGADDQQILALTQWFGDHAQENCKRVFGAYLDFSKWR